MPASQFCCQSNTALEKKKCLKKMEEGEGMLEFGKCGFKILTKKTFLR